MSEQRPPGGWPDRVSAIVNKILIAMPEFEIDNSSPHKNIYTLYPLQIITWCNWKKPCWEENMNPVSITKTTDVEIKLVFLSFQLIHLISKTKSDLKKEINVLLRKNRTFRFNLILIRKISMTKKILISNNIKK